MKRKSITPKILGFGHQARVGKDEACNYIARKIPNSRRRAFADSLKEACACIFGFDECQLYGHRKEEVDPFWQTTPRDLLQRVGTEAIRNEVGRNVWVHSWERYLEKYSDFDGLWLVPDVRFRNEVDAIKRTGGVVVKIHRPEGMRDRVSMHVSETELLTYQGWDYVIHNDCGTLSPFYRSVHKMLRTFNLVQ